MNNNKNNKNLNKIAEMLSNKNISKKVRMSNSDDILNKAGFFVENAKYGFIDITHKGKDVKFKLNDIELPVTNIIDNKFSNLAGMSFNELPLEIFDSIVFKYNDYNNKEINLLEMHPELSANKTKVDILGNFGLGLDKNFLEDDLDKQYNDAHIDLASKINDNFSFKLVLFSDMDKYQRNEILNSGISATFARDDMSFKKKGYSLMSDTEFDLLGKTVGVSIASFKLESLYNNDDHDVRIYNSNQVQERSFSNQSGKEVEGLKLNLNSKLNERTNITASLTTSELKHDRYFNNNIEWENSFYFDPNTTILYDVNGEPVDLTTQEGQEIWLQYFFNKWDNGNIYGSSDSTLTVAGNGLLDCYSIDLLLREIFSIYNPNNTRVWNVNGSFRAIVCGGYGIPGSCTIPTIDAVDFAAFKTWFYLRMNDQLPIYTGWIDGTGTEGNIPLDFFDKVYTDIKIVLGKKTITKNGLNFTKYPDMNFVIPRTILNTTFNDEQENISKNRTFRLDIDSTLSNPFLDKVNLSYTNKLDEYFNVNKSYSASIPANLQGKESNFNFVNINTSGKLPEMGAVYANYVRRDFINNNKVNIGEAEYLSSRNGNLTVNENIFGMNLKGNLLDIDLEVDLKYLVTSYDSEGTLITYNPNTEDSTNTDRDLIDKFISSKEDSNLLASINASYKFDNLDKLEINTKYYQSLNDNNKINYETYKELWTDPYVISNGIVRTANNEIYGIDQIIINEPQQPVTLQDVEIFDNYEIGLNYKFSENFSLNANAFHKSGNLNNILTRFSITDYNIDNGQVICNASYFDTNAQIETQISGFNVSVDLKKLNLSSDTNANIRTALTYMDRASLTSPLSENNDANSYSLKSTSEIELTKGSLVMTPIIVYNVPERYKNEDGGSYINSSSGQQEIVVNLRGSYDIDPSLSANIKIDNLWRSGEFDTNGESLLKEHFRPVVKAGIKKSF